MDNMPYLMILMRCIRACRFRHYARRTIWKKVHRRRRQRDLRSHGRQRQGRPAGLRLEGRRHSEALSGGLSSKSQIYNYKV